MIRLRSRVGFPQWLLSGLVGPVLYIVAAVAGTANAQQLPICDTPTTPFCNAVTPLPAGWHGHIFQVSQNYPADLHKDIEPWMAFDPVSQPAQYIGAVLAYFYEGNLRSDIETSFEPRLNTVRGWYTAPWQDFGTNGREPIHGLTRERVSQPFELDPHQSHIWNNYAVGFYNAPGGFTIGRVWANHGRPNAPLEFFPNGTVAAKLLFTTASVVDVPYLRGAPAWNAFVYADLHDLAPKPNSPRAIIQVHLLQIDVAVKDPRVAATTGWVFGTFVYGGGPGGRAGKGWTNVSSVGLMWGNDPDHVKSGPLTQTWLNPDVHIPHVG